MTALLFPLNWFRASKARCLEQQRQTAREAYDAAKRRGDTRKQHEAEALLREATTAALKAQVQR